MAKALLFLTDGFEEIEALTVVDILRRCDVEVKTVSLTDVFMVEGSHNIRVESDILFDEVSWLDGDDLYDMVILPGGPGTKNYKKHDSFLELIKKHYDNGKYVAAICAAPSILGMLDMLNEKKAVCYPGYENELTGADICEDNVIADDNVITSRGAGTAIDFALKLAEVLVGEEAARKIGRSIIYLK